MARECSTRVPARRGGGDARLALLALAVVACRPSPVGVPAPSADLVADVTYLASPALAGRGMSTPGSDSAALYIVRRHASLGLEGAFSPPCTSEADCAPLFVQLFDLDGQVGRNVGVVIPGTDAELNGQYVVVGAHYDHLGRSSFGATDPERGEVVRPGADDNASGTAAVLELARRLSAQRTRRSVLLVHFDAEEVGLVGSRVFVENPPVALSSMVLMLNLDMVGRLRDGRLTVDAGESPVGVRRMIEAAARRTGVPAGFSSLVAGRSDHDSFRRAGVPAVALFTGYHRDYHTVSDVASRLDLRGLARVIDLAESIVRAAGDQADSIARPPL